MAGREVNVRSPTLSPDGRWLAYESGGVGPSEVFVRPFPNADSGVWQVSAGGGSEPVWSHSGRELFFRNGSDDVGAVQVATGSSFDWDGQVVLLSAADYLRGSGHPMYDVSPDDQEFVMLRLDGDQASEGQLIVVQNFFEELKRLAPVN